MNNKERKAALTQIDKINTCAVMSHSYNPRRDRAIGVAIIAFVVPAYLLYHYNIDSVVDCGFISVLAVVCGFIYYRFSSHPPGYVFAIDAILAQYDPLDRNAFIELQESARRGEGFYPNVVKWLVKELQAIDGQENQNSDTKLKFTSRKIV